MPISRRFFEEKEPSTTRRGGVRTFVQRARDLEIEEIFRTQRVELFFEQQPLHFLFTGNTAPDVVDEDHYSYETEPEVPLRDLTWDQVVADFSDIVCTMITAILHQWPDYYPVWKINPDQDTLAFDRDWFAQRQDTLKDTELHLFLCLYTEECLQVLLKECTRGKLEAARKLIMLRPKWTLRVVYALDTWSEQDLNRLASVVNAGVVLDEDLSWPFIYRPN